MNTQRGFTLVELLSVLVVAAISACSYAFVLQSMAER